MIGNIKSRLGNSPEESGPVTVSNERAPATSDPLAYRIESLTDQVQGMRSEIRAGTRLLGLSATILSLLMLFAILETSRFATTIENGFDRLEAKLEQSLNEVDQHSDQASDARDEPEQDLPSEGEAVPTQELELDDDSVDVRDETPAP